VLDARVLGHGVFAVKVHGARNLRRGRKRVNSIWRYQFSPVRARDTFAGHRSRFTPDASAELREELLTGVGRCGYL
jgi:hypothetical protein